MIDEPTTFAELSPDLVLNAMESIGLRGDGRLLALNSYENRVYQIGLEQGLPQIVKFYRPERWGDSAIVEEHRFIQELAEHEIPVSAPRALDGSQTLYHFQGYRFAVFPRLGGHAPELGGRETLEWMGRLIGRIHAIGAQRPFQHRPYLDIASFGEEPRDYLLAHAFIPADLIDVYSGVVEQALAGVRHCFERAGPVPGIRLHGDCYPGNILWNDAGPHFVDFDDSRMGPAVQDLWMLLSGSSTEMARQLEPLLAGYLTFFDFDPRQLHLIEALRSLRLIHYSAWLAQRWSDPAFPMAFPWFNTPRYWQDRILELREQIALMAEEPLIVGNFR